jgi:hypothetical protein
MAGAAVVRGHPNLGVPEAARREQVCSRARALQHDDGAASRDQCLDDAGKHRDAQAASDTDDASVSLQVEALAVRAQQVQLVTFIEAR